MPPRPTSLTVVAIILLVLGCLAPVNLVVALVVPMTRELMHAQPIPVPLQIAQGIIAAIVLLATGSAVLRRLSWGRWLYVAWHAVSLPVSFATSPSKLMLVPGTLMIIVIIALLFSRKANAWFATPSAGTDHA